MFEYTTFDNSSSFPVEAGGVATKHNIKLGLPLIEIDREAGSDSKSISDKDNGIDTDADGNEKNEKTEKIEKKESIMTPTNRLEHITAVPLEEMYLGKDEQIQEIDTNTAGIYKFKGFKGFKGFEDLSFSLYCWYLISIYMWSAALDC